VRSVCSMIATLWIPRLSDKIGRKPVLMLSLFGCSMGYFVQGSSSLVSESGFWTPIKVFMVGRGLAGLFSATRPILQAYVTEVFCANHEILKKRLVMMGVCAQASGIVLQPLSSVFSSRGLHIPFFVSFGVGALGTILCCLTFREVSEIRAMTELTQPLASGLSTNEANPQQAIQDAKPQVEEDQPEVEQGNPFKDKVILLATTAFFVLGILMSTFQFLVPLLLAQPSFGLQQETAKATQQQIAAASGRLYMPFGVCTLLVTLLLYVPVSRRFGEVPVLLVAGLGASISFGSYGFWVTKIWQLMVMHGFGGACLGFLTPATSPLIGRYAAVHYNKKIGVCQAIPMLGMQLSMSFGQNIMAWIYQRGEDIQIGYGQKICWVVSGFCLFGFTMCMATAFRLVEKRCPKQDSLSSEQRKVLLAKGGDGAAHPPQDTDEFIESMVAYVRQSLDERKGELWNGTAQFLYQDAVDKSLRPRFRKWDEETKGREYLEDMHSLLLDHPVELNEFCQKFPHIVHSVRDETFSPMAGPLHEPSSFVAAQAFLMPASAHANPAYAENPAARPCQIALATVVPRNSETPSSFGVSPNGARGSLKEPLATSVEEAAVKGP